MAKRPRFIPPGSLVEVSCRTIGSRYLLRPSKELNDLAAGILARAARLYPVGVVHFVALSSHFHGLLVVESAQRLADFMRYLDSNLALEIGRLHDWETRFWGQPYAPIPVSDEERAQVARLKYLLAAGVKEHLVERVLDWPGLHCARHLLVGSPLAGSWISHTYEYRQQRCGKRVDPEEARSVETLRFARLPCWAHLSDEEYRERIAELIEEIEREAAADRRAQGKRVLGRRAILRKHPHFRPPREKRSRRPLCFAASKEAKRRFREAFRAFLAAYSEASARLRDGDRNVVFPENCFPPALPFTGCPRAGPLTSSASAP